MDTADSAAASPLVFDHVGLVVKTLERGRAALEPAISRFGWTAPIDDPVNGVRLQFGRDAAGMVYELLVPLDGESPVFRALKSGKGILNHVAYRVADLAAGAERMRAARWLPTAAPKPAIAYGGAPIQFFLSPVGLIVELIEAPDFAHDYVNRLPSA